jgi:hypothetical protein
LIFISGSFTLAAGYAPHTFSFHKALFTNTLNAIESGFDNRVPRAEPVPKNAVARRPASGSADVKQSLIVQRRPPRPASFA